MSENQYSLSPTLNEALQDTTERLKLNVTTGEEGPICTPSPSSAVEPPPFSVPIRRGRAKKMVENISGVEVSRALIDEAVRHDRPSDTHSPGTARPGGEVEIKTKRLFEEVKKDLEISKQVVASINKRLNNPLDPQEKYVSYNAMSEPLKRVVKAYIDLDAAKKELQEAVTEMNAVATEASKA